MPKVTWRNSTKKPLPPVKADYLGDLITRHMRERKITYATLSPKVGLTIGAARCKKHYGVGNYKVDDLFAWCRALGVDADSLACAVRLAYESGKRE